MHPYKIGVIAILVQALIYFLVCESNIQFGISNERWGKLQDKVEKWFLPAFLITILATGCVELSSVPCVNEYYATC